MTRNLKALGLALVAAFALSAIAASAASAQQAYLTSDGPVTLIGEEVGEENENRLTSFGNFTQCPGSTYTGHAVDVTPHESLPPHSTAVTITPHYVNCEATGLGFPTTVNMNGCDYVFDLGETTESPDDTYGILSTVDCPENSHIVVTSSIFGSHCTVTITEDPNGYEGLDVTDNTDGTVTVSGTIEGIEAHRKGGFGCSEETTNTGELHQNVLVEGQNEEGGPTTLHLSELGDETIVPPEG